MCQTLFNEIMMKRNEMEVGNRDGSDKHYPVYNKQNENTLFMSVIIMLVYGIFHIYLTQHLPFFHSIHYMYGSSFHVFPHRPCYAVIHLLNNTSCPPLIEIMY